MHGRKSARSDKRVQDENVGEKRVDYKSREGKNLLNIVIYALPYEKKYEIIYMYMCLYVSI